MVSGCCRVAVGGSNTSGQAVSQASESRPDYTLAGEQAEEGGGRRVARGEGEGGHSLLPSFVIRPSVEHAHRARERFRRMYKCLIAFIH